MRLKQEVEKIRPELIIRKGVLLHHDNGRPHTSLATQKIGRDFADNSNSYHAIHAMPQCAGVYSSPENRKYRCPPFCQLDGDTRTTVTGPESAYQVFIRLALANVTSAGWDVHLFT
ncbi:hypothetical protein EVAR_25393_1 [Eumeta japonica]|uniref:Histone-lysine N-methyltransferase SETMAR n=1 Tax=Eumeta variegata TaxID=151549 RepID=A0A4C1V6A1_EUMVA|nr:hypothetical protein EVAR_25393_1 [Eumeta japonica]